MRWRNGQRRVCDGANVASRARQPTHRQSYQRRRRCPAGSRDIAYCIRIRTCPRRLRIAALAADAVGTASTGDVASGLAARTACGSPAQGSLPLAELCAALKGGMACAAGAAATVAALEAGSGPLT